MAVILEALAMDVNMVMVALHNDLVGTVMVVVGFWRSDWRTTKVYTLVVPFHDGIVAVMTAARGPIVSFVATVYNDLAVMGG